MSNASTLGQPLALWKDLQVLSFTLHMWSSPTLHIVDSPLQKLIWETNLCLVALKRAATGAYPYVMFISALIIRLSAAGGNRQDL